MAEIYKTFMAEADEVRYLREVARLTAERDAWRADFNALQRVIVGNTGASGITLAAEHKRDAQRYRWLRDEAPAFVVHLLADKPGAEWNAAIDAEMRARGG